MPRARWFRGLVAVSRFFCFPIVKNIAENQKWPGNPVWRAAVSNPPGRYMRGGPLARQGPSGSLRVGKIKKVVKRRGVGVLALRLEIYFEGATEQQVDMGCRGRGLFFGWGGEV